MFDQGLDYRHTMQGSPCDAVQSSLPIRKKPERVRLSVCRPGLELEQSTNRDQTGIAVQTGMP